ncbi:hypothetical protein TorRG33x02_306500 [Trema orientale]|uniref:Uncharacterized protein n=1 Tax=Trema orientale TaxID=63057 RepID=A0A2P5BW76_TREOI|nr:hypothetical protein TorRG33x02_306500 [Trema orientale]
MSKKRQKGTNEKTGLMRLRVTVHHHEFGSLIALSAAKIPAIWTVDQRTDDSPLVMPYNGLNISERHRAISSLSLRSSLEIWNKSPHGHGYVYALSSSSYSMSSISTSSYDIVSSSSPRPSEATVTF